MSGKKRKQRLLVCFALAAMLFVFTACGGADVNINFDTGGEEVIESVTVKAGDEINEPIVNRDGYHISGWYENGDYSTDKVSFPYAATKSVTLYAKWSPNVYTVTYNANGGDTVNEYNSVIYGEDFELEIPLRGGYTFGGWWIDSESGETLFAGADGKGMLKWEFLDDISVYAKWTPDSYTVTYDAQAGTVGNNSAIIAYGKEFVLDVPARSGYTFAGWWGMQDCGGTQYTGKDGAGLFDWDITKDITLYAGWTANKYTVTCDASSGKIKIPAMQVTFDEDFELEVPVKNESVFRGWWGDPDCIGIQYTDAAGKGLFDWNVSGNLTLYAKWEYMKLPVMRISLPYGVKLSNVDRENYVDSTVTVESDISGYALAASPCEFRGRGNGSWSEPKKGYRLKFNSKQPLFGNVTSKHWALIASSTDQSFIRGSSAFNVAKNVLTGIEYTTGYTNIELYVNNEYQGVYHVYDHVRVDKGRVDIKSEFGVENTGYLIEYDAYFEGREGIEYFKVNGLKYPFMMKSPDPDDYLVETTEEKYRAQVAYIKGYVATVYAAALRRDFDTFAQYADVQSFVDMYILHELYKNTDTGWSSFFLYKKPNGLLYAGPPWDFDFTAGRSRGESSSTGIYVAGTCATHSNYTSSELYINLYKTSGFLNAVKERWQEVSGDIRSVINNMITTDYIAFYRSDYGKNNIKWHGDSQSSGETRWVNQVTDVKSWLLSRITWLNTEWA